jgi:hypothetical protein
MNRWTVLIATLLFVFAMSCSGGSGNTPVVPDASSGTNLTGNSAVTESNTSNYLWGYYTINVDVENQVVESVMDRTAMFNANVVSFLNGNPAALAFNIIETPIGPDYIDVDIDVTITHPLPGLPQYDGYDVRGIFIGDGSGSVDGGLATADIGTDQRMLPDPDDGTGAPDGYTRWFNASEFNGGLDVLQFVDGIFASKSYTGTSEVNAYKYFADGLGANDDEFDFLINTADNGVFSSGSANTRNYYIRFEGFPGPVNYDYAVVASWKGEDPGDHPANTEEAVAISVTQTPHIFFDGVDSGGDIILDFDLFGWGGQPSSIIVESNVLAGPAVFDPGTIATGGGSNYSTYHVEVPSTSVTSNYGNDYWVICKYDNFDYSNEFAVPNDASSDTLTAYFRYDLYVATESPCAAVEVTGTDTPVVSAAALTGIEIYGTGFLGAGSATTADVSYVHPVDGTVVATNVAVIDDTTITCDADFTGWSTNDAGVDIEVTNDCGELGVGEDLVEFFLPTAYPTTPNESTYDSGYETDPGTRTNCPFQDDGYYAGAPIGFTFSYGTTNYTTANLSYNGILMLNGTFGCCTPGCTSSYLDIFGLGEDLNTAAGGVMAYQTKDVNGVQCFIQEFENVPSWFNSGSNTYQNILFDEPFSQYDKFATNVLLHFDFFNDLWYRHNNVSFCAYASGVPDNTLYEWPGI